MNQNIINKLLKVLHEQETFNEHLEEIARAFELNQPMFKDDGTHQDTIEPYKFSVMAERQAYKAETFARLCEYLDEYTKLFELIGRELKLNRDDSRDETLNPVHTH